MSKGRRTVSRMSSVQIENRSSDSPSSNSCGGFRPTLLGATVPKSKIALTRVPGLSSFLFLCLQKSFMLWTLLMSFPISTFCDVLRYQVLYIEF